MANNDYLDYLKHHGIKGQKHGIQNGPPYPLDYKKHSAEEKKKMKPSLKDRLREEAMKKERKKKLERESRINKTSTYKKDKVEDLSNRELKARQDRMYMENQYTRSVKEATERKSESSAFVKSAMKEAANKALVSLGKDVMVYTGKQAIKKVISEEAYQEMFYNKYDGKKQKKDN